MNLFGYFKTGFRNPWNTKVYNPLLPKGSDEDSTIVPWHISAQGTNERATTFKKRWRGLMFRWKYWIIVPGLFLLRRLNKRHWKGVPAYPYNDRLSLYWDVVNKAAMRWNDDCLQMKNGQVSGSVSLWLEVHKTYLTYCLNDNAYRELHAFYIDAIFEAEYERRKSLKGFQHLMYFGTGTPVPHYIAMYPKVETGEIFLECASCTGLRVKEAEAIRKAGFVHQSTIVAGVERYRQHLDFKQFLTDMGIVSTTEVNTNEPKVSSGATDILKDVLEQSIQPPGNTVDDGKPLDATGELPSSDGSTKQECIAPVVVPIGDIVVG